MGFDFSKVPANVVAYSDLANSPSRRWVSPSSNEDGEYDTVEVWGVYAQDVKGYRVYRMHDFEGKADAVDFAIRVGGSSRIVNPDYWISSNGPGPGASAYGSEAYIESNQGRQDLFDELRSAQVAGEDIRDEDFVRACAS